MSLFAEYLTEDELLAEFREKKIPIKNKRTLRGWRQRRIGPPWAKFSDMIIYPTDGFKAYLRAQVQQPVRSRRTLNATEAHTRCLRGTSGSEDLDDHQQRPNNPPSQPMQAARSLNRGDRDHAQIFHRIQTVPPRCSICSTHRHLNRATAAGRHRARPRAGVGAMPPFNRSRP